MPRLTTRQMIAGALMGVGFLMAVALAVLAGRKNEPAVATSVLFVVLSGVFQFAGAKVLQGEGQADPSLAGASLRRLMRLQRRAQEAETVAQEAFESGDPKTLRTTMGRLSVEFSWLSEGLIEATEDWASFHGSVLADLRKELEGDGADQGEGGRDLDGHRTRLESRQ